MAIASTTNDCEDAVYLHGSVIQGHHIYKSVWTPVLGEVLSVSIEEGNSHDRFAVCMKRGKLIVGHVPREISCKVWCFLRHGGQCTCEVTG